MTVLTFSRRLMLVAVLAIAASAPLGCGGGGSSGGGGGETGGEVTWPDRDGGMSTMLPAAINTARVVFDSASGERCCVAVDPALLGTGGGLAILDDLPVGPATVTVSGFTTDFAPAVPGITETCHTVPANAAQACDPVQVAPPAFSSDPIAVTILPGVRTDVGDVAMQALPFLLDFAPPQDAEAAPPVLFAFTVVDALTNIRQDSVALDVSFEVEDPAEPSGFRAISKRVPLEFVPCSDGSEQPCSPAGDLALDGFKASGVAPELPLGEVEAHIVAQNQGSPPRDLDFRYPLFILATPAPSPTPTGTPEGTIAVTAGDTGAAAAAANGSASLDAPAAGGRFVTPTPTATPTPDRTL